MSLAFQTMGRPIINGQKPRSTSVTATSLRDCVRMSEIAAEMMSRAKIDDNSLNFAVFHLACMLSKLETEYDARWHGEPGKP
jgi:hypothetical protein